MKIALFGPGHGHNMYSFISYFDKDSRFEVDFYYHGDNQFEKEYNKLNYFKFSKKFLYFVFNVRKYDFIWLMGGGRLIYLLFIPLLFKKKKCVTILHIWGETLPLRAVSDNIFGKFTRFLIKYYEVINCNWYGTAEILKKKIKNGSVKVNVLGLSEEYFLKPNPVDQEIIKLKKKVSKNSYNFYYPKSFLSVSRHDLVVEAVKILKMQNLPAFKVYFIDGNAVNIERQNYIKDLVKKYDLSETVILLERVKYFDTKNFNLMWEVMDCGLQIAEHDQLSNTIFEPLINKKELIISNIPPYKYLKKYFGFDFNLVPLDANKIAEEMKKKILNENAKNQEQKERIKNIIIDKYYFSTNFNKALNKMIK
ncbi:glycosyltransferase [Polaribacter batillariae]|uniref:Glycosyltransferase n=1 Tax=Polaribacter batillariae TaxID=2808900 RepID=A0ABX7SWF3_9FLAO|nr:glycosyltransferase [Polaribacter batillariae]QTD37306.1 glycosyltransferase [Polaribacter batillariae]